MANVVQSGTKGAAIVEEEERLYARVQARVALGDRREGKAVAAADIDPQLIELRDAIAEAKPEDLAPLVEQMTRLAALRARLGGSRTLPIDVRSPYFAHMALEEGGKARDVLIGKRGFIDRESNVQIVDWRNAPISRIYYRYDEGDDYEEEIAGRRIEGIVSKRRNVSINNKVLRRIGTPQGTYIRDARAVWHEAVGQAAPQLAGGAGKAVRVPEVPRNKPDRGRRGRRKRGKLGVHHGPTMRADHHLPEIAALIDKDQFELITEPESGMVVIQGGAGSGKTTVALHRIAYLSFADRHRFSARKVLFVVPSKALVRYVSGVLPALGVQGVPVVTYRGWARNMRIKLLKGTRGLYNEDTPHTVSRLKKHPAMLAILEDFAAEQAELVARDLAELLGDSGAAVVDQWNTLSGMHLVPRLGTLLRWVRSESSNLAPATRNAAEGRLKQLRRRSADVITDWGEMLTDTERLTRGFAGDPDVRPGQIAKLVEWCTRQNDGLHDGGAASDEVTGADGRALGSEDDPAGRFDYEDDPILLRLTQIKRGGLYGPDGKETLYQHVAIDEAQDRSAIEVKVLLEATAAADGNPARRSITIAGDTAQRLVFDNNFTGWSALLEQTGHAAVVRPLKLSYRSTAQVMELARDVLGDELAPKEAIAAREGAPVELHEFGDIGEAVAFLGDALRMLMSREPSASVAVVSRHSEQADAYYAGLARAEVPNLRRVRRDDFSFRPGIDVVEVSHVKGLEFDYVVMVDVTAATYPPNVDARHLLHIGATRAAHQLWLVSSGEPSPLLPDSMRFGASELADSEAETATGAAE